MELVDRLRILKLKASTDDGLSEKESHSDLIARIDESLKIILNSIQEYG